MPNDGSTVNPAEEAARQSLIELTDCLNQRKCFVLEAGAGAGKTYSLIYALKYLIRHKGTLFLENNQRIACLTYTNVAKDEIRSRTDSHPVVISETIHSFCWSILKDFQKNLQEIIPSLPNWPERITEAGGNIQGRKIVYELGYAKINDHEVLLHHDDVISLMVKLMEKEKFRKVFSNKFPILFIDEYQDTNKDFAESLKKHFIQEKCGPLIGFFGDHWQKIFGSDSCGKIEHENLMRIDKKANFRSDKIIVDCLNKIRTELPQHPKNSESSGTVKVFHTNTWQGTRQSGSHWAGDLPSEISRKCLSDLRDTLEQEGWDFSPQKSKILMLTNNVLAEEQGYRGISKSFTYNESYLKKEDAFIAFFVDILEPVCLAYQNRKYGEMFAALGKKHPSIRRHSDKSKWQTFMTSLMAARASGTIGDVLEILKNNSAIRLTEKISQRISRYSDLKAKQEAEWNESDKKFMDRDTKLRAVPYKELIILADFINNRTPFSTQHGVKGEEFENVLVVFGRGWNHYNFREFLEMAKNGIPAGKEGAFERNRNLFYVACSRPIKRLTLLFTQELSNDALDTISNWFGRDSVIALDIQI